VKSIFGRRKVNMKIEFIINRIILSGTLVLLFLLFHNFNLNAQENRDVNLKIHLTGVYSSKVSLLPLSGAGALKPFIEKPGIKNGQTTVLTIPKDRLPGQFVLRFDYEEKEGSTPYPSERYFFIGSQDLEMWVKPKAVNNPDSTYFQKGEKENTLFATFSMENGKRKQQLGLLQNFLMGYDRPEAKFYSIGVEEYENRRNEYNSWLNAQVDTHKDAFVSCIFPLQYVSPIAWKGTEKERLNSLMVHYFDGIDFKNPLLAKTADLKDWMNKYVNLYGAMSTTVALRDSLFTLAGKRAIEKASQGDPKVYGWMVDYFYQGYETFAISSGMKMLEQHIQNPNCLTSKRQEIIRRLDGMEKLKPGADAPSFEAEMANGMQVRFNGISKDRSYGLLLFYDSECSHCKELLQELKTWIAKPQNGVWFDLVTIAVDQTHEKWKSFHDQENYPWTDVWASGGINSKVANDYYILSTPVIYIIDKEMKVMATPQNIKEIDKFLNQ